MCGGGYKPLIWSQGWKPYEVWLRWRTRDIDQLRNEGSRWMHKGGSYCFVPLISIGRNKKQPDVDGWEKEEKEVSQGHRVHRVLIVSQYRHEISKNLLIRSELASYSRSAALSKFINRQYAWILHSVRLSPGLHGFKCLVFICTPLSLAGA